jgi:hypothetical protein
VVSKKVYQDRITRGVCVRCGDDRQESGSKQCPTCVAKAKAKRGPIKPLSDSNPIEKEEELDPEQVIEAYGGKCEACHEGEMGALQVVSDSLDNPEKRTFRQLVEYLIDHHNRSGKWMSGYEVMCAPCFRERAIVYAIKLEGLV